MEHRIRISDEAFRAYEKRAKQIGLTVDEYLDRSAPSGSEFTLTPEMRAGIERGLELADSGKLIGISQVRESLAKYGEEWRAKGKR